MRHAAQNDLDWNTLIRAHKSYDEEILPSIDSSLHQKKQPAIGEILSSSVTGVVAQCWQIYDDAGMPSVVKPAFGSFLTIDSTESKVTTYAILYNIITGPKDNVHRPAALGLSRERLKVEQPHIFSLLQTELHAAIIAHKIDGRIYSHLPPQPPDVHDFVYQTEVADVQAITRDFDFLRPLTTIANAPNDELIAACIRSAYQAGGSQYDFLVAAGQALSQLLRSDYDRLLCVLKKIRN
jgi:hypothetical protein